MFGFKTAQFWARFGPILNPVQACFCLFCLNFAHSFQFSIQIQNELTLPFLIFEKKAMHTGTDRVKNVRFRHIDRTLIFSVLDAFELILRFLSLVKMEIFYRNGTSVPCRPTDIITLSID